MNLDLVVVRACQVAPDIREVVLARADRGLLPPYPPGSHVIVECGTQRNAYSLTGSGMAPSEYAIAVLRKHGGAGSEHMHRIQVGDTVRVTTPRNAFPLVNTARRHLLIAGGIGITPLLSHARHAVRWGCDVQLLYRHRPGAGAYLVELEALLGDRMRCITNASDFTLLLKETLTEQPIGTHLYVCGPQGLMDRVLTQATAAGWPPERLHLERFVPVELDAGEPFTARLARSGRDVAVPAGVSLLAALERAGVAVPNMCRQGVCGECRIPVLAGAPLHRDDYLSEEERDADDSIMSCVSRSTTETLEIDL